MKNKGRKALVWVLMIATLILTSLQSVYAQVWSSEQADGFASGSGTQVDPYVIKTPNQLAYLAEKVNGGNKYSDKFFVLENDITFNDETFEFDSDTGLVKVSDGINVAYLGTGILGDSSGANTVFDDQASQVGAWYVSDLSDLEGEFAGTLYTWTPIGKENKRFEGNFNANGHTVSGLYVNTSANYGGLFGNAYSTIENLTIINSYVCSGESTGAVAGSNLGTAQNCSADAIVCSIKNNVGGLVGKGGTVNKCMSACVVSGAQNVGGVAGSAKVQECYSINLVVGAQNVGGIVGVGRGANNLNSASVFGKECVGGICGSISGSSYTLETSYNCGNVYGEKYVGSVLGRLVSGKVENCYYLVNTAIDSSNKIQNGIGAASKGASRADQSGATEGLDVVESKTKEAFGGFDFDNVWTMSENGDLALAALKSEDHTHVYDNSCDKNCNVCGEIRSVEHSYKVDWSNDELSHWHVCLVCADKKDISEHNFDNVCDAVCNECNYTRIAPHSYKKSWSSDEGSHWHECANCTDKTGVENHTAGTEATEDSPQTCTVCDYVIVAALGHTHKYSNVWSYDQTSHWHVCPCGAQDDLNSHVYDDACDTTCNDCSWVRIINHSYKSTWSVDQTSHWKECTVCSHKKDLEKHEPGAKATEDSPQTCTVCDYVIVAALGHTHKYSNVWSYDQTSHWHACPCGAQDDLGNHIYDNACDTTCNDCSWVRIVNHSYKSMWSMDEQSHWKECTVCGKIKDKDNHTPGAEATEDSAQTCTVCDYVIVAALGHTHKFSNDWTKDATSHWHACPCGAQDDINNHVYDNACDTTCNDCSWVRIINHSYKSTWSVDQTSHWKECTVCSHKKDLEKHEPGAKATEDTPQTCTVCDYVIVAALGHTHKFSNDWTKDATSHWHACPCGAQDDLNSHVYDDACDTTCNDCYWVRIINHSYKSTWSMDEQSHWKECTICGKTKDKDNHTLGAEATEDSAQTCTVCDYVIVAALGHTHKYSNVWSYDQTSHWHACPCGAQDDLGNHVYDNACDTTCNDCSWVRIINHSYKSTWSVDQTFHWKECTVCSYKKDLEKHEPGAKATEDTPQTCTVCDYVIVAALGHMHKFSNDWTKDATSHWHVCPCGAQDDINNHVYDNTCDTTCNDCSWVRKIEHEYVAAWSCDAKYHWHECSVCHEQKNFEQHQYDNACDTVCNVCLYVRVVEHTYSTSWSSDQNSHWYECFVCGEKSNLENHKAGAAATENAPQTCTECKFVIAPALTHTHKYADIWSSDKTNHWKNCDCQDKGFIEKHEYDNPCDTICNVCQHERSVTHTYSETKKHDEKSHWIECTVCQAKINSDIHVFDGLCDSSCNECTYTRKITHAYNQEYHSDENGHWKECILCNAASETDQHVFDNGTLIKEPTLHEEGIKAYKCIGCSFTKNELIAKLPEENTDALTTPGQPVTSTPVTSENLPLIEHGSATEPSGGDNTGCNGNNCLVLIIVLGVISVVLLVTLLIMILYVLKKKDK